VTQQHWTIIDPAGAPMPSYSGGDPRELIRRLKLWLHMSWEQLTAMGFRIVEIDKPVSDGRN
jgi:hypothetical protein